MEKISTICVDDHEFVIPKQKVKHREDMYVWRRSQANHDSFTLLLSLNAVFRGKPFRVDCEKSPVTEGLTRMLDVIHGWIDEILPARTSLRARTEAFKMWHSKLKSEANKLLVEALPDELYCAIVEVVIYLLQSFGNTTYFAYDPSNELSFLMFLCCLVKIGAFTTKDQEGMVTFVFNRYLSVIRKLHSEYGLRLVPGCSVWRWDDCFYLPYIWGSSQLIGHPHLSPSSILEPDCTEMYSTDYMFMACVNYINQIKTGHFAEHSNQLWNISSISSWTKINEHLMYVRYREDVLERLHLVQCMQIGSLMTLDPCPREPEWVFQHI